MTVHILLATYQGALHLPEQLRSIEQQSASNWHLWARDDGSQDGTQALLDAFKQQHGDRVTLLQRPMPDCGPGLGAAHNFFALVHAVAPGAATDLFAFCDQDDVWLPEKLARACQWHAASPCPDTPQLYCARTQVTDARLQPLHLSSLPRRPLTLHNALVENVASGNTMVLNLALLQALRRIDPQQAVLHDWSTYLGATACGGTVHFDPQPCLLYRQHAGNVVGARKSRARHWARLGSLLQGGYRTWGDATEHGLQDLAPLLTPESHAIAAAFHAARHSPNATERLRHARRAGLVRQRRSAQLALWAAVLLKLL